MLYLLIFLLPLLVSSHFYTQYPPARSTGSGLKTYPCGGLTFGSGARTTLSPGRQTIQLKETINHNGAPRRIAISYGDDSKYDDLVLYDHIPHFDGGINGEKLVDIVVDIPDISCDNCALQVISVMTDKISPGTCCSYVNGDGCSSVYHSCSDIEINGTVLAVGSVWMRLLGGWICLVWLSLRLSLFRLILIGGLLRCECWYRLWFSLFSLLRFGLILIGCCWFRLFWWI